MTQIDPNPGVSEPDTDLTSAQHQVLSTTTSQTLFPQFLLFGDSIIELSVTTLQTSLQALYIRRLDILNRGFAGYNTTLALQTLSHFLPINTPSPTSSTCIPPIKLTLIFFGANDACLPGNAQHVPLTQFVDNIRRMTTYPVFTRHNTKLLLMTPPPIDEHQATLPLQRTAQNASLYASAVRSLAQDLSLPIVDIWQAYMDLCGYDASQPDQPLPGSRDLPANPQLAELLLDGLHPTPYGYEVISRELIKVIANDVPECLPENLPMIFREWREVLDCPKVT